MNHSSPPISRQDRGAQAAAGLSIAAFDALPFQVALLDARGTILSVNQCWERTGQANGLQTANCGVGQNYFDLSGASAAATPTEDAQVVSRGIRQVLEGSAAEFSFEYPCDTVKERLWFRMTARPLVFEGTRGALVMHVDISEQKRAELATRHSTALLQAVIADTSDGIFVRDRVGRFLLCNRAQAEFLGVQAEALIGNDGSAALGGALADAMRDRDGVVLASGKAFTHEFDLSSGGATRVLMSSRSPYFNEHGDIIGVIGVARDITDRQRDRDALLKLNAELDARVRARTEEMLRERDAAQEANRAKSSFLAAMSHEIRTPMNGVIGMVDVLHQTSLLGYQVQMVDLIRDSAFSLLKIIDDILDFSKIEAGKLTIEERPMRVADVIESACGMLDHVATKAAVGVRLFVHPAMPVALLGDETRLRQVLVNLVGNAIKFSGGGPHAGQVSVRAVVVGEPPKRTLELVVTDNGIGIDAETQSRLFTPFSQADASTTRRFGGTGLGLAISNMLVDLMGGEIALRSAPGQGATFTVRLHFAEAETPDQVIDAAPTVTGLRCRIVGSGIDEVLADDFSTYLTHAGAIVERFASLAEAAAQPQALGLWIWLVLPGQQAPDLPDLRAMAPGQPDAHTHFIVFGTGNRRRPRIEDADFIRIDVHMLLRRTLLKTIALAAGQVREEDVNSGPDVPKSLVRVPARHEACLQRRLILVAEDNETNRTVIRNQLEMIGFASEIVVNGREALKQWRTGDFALLLTDIHMPELDGYELTSAIRAEEGDGQRMPIIALTANALRDEELRCRAAGVDKYLTKPIRLALLKAAIEEWLGPAADGEALPKPGSGSVGSVGPADLAVLEALVGDDKAVIEEVLDAFRASALQSNAEMRRGIEDLSYKSVSATAHRFKSAARSIGAMRLDELCQAIETAADAGSSHKLLTTMPMLEAELTAVMGFLDS